MKKKTYIYRGFERFWHWSQALLIFFLAFTGFEVHGTFHCLGFRQAVAGHDIAAWALLVLIVFAIFWHIVTGEWKQYIPTTRFIRAQISYYITGIFKGAPHPTHKTIYNKFNPLQRIIYLGLKLLVIPVQVITGLLFMFYLYPNNLMALEGLTPVAYLHTIGAFVLLAFVVAHVYLTTTGDTPLSSIKAMITGWETIDIDEREEHRQHMQEAVDKSVAGYYRLDRQGIIVDVNEAWLRMYHCDNRDAYVGKHYTETRNEKDISTLTTLVNNVMKGESITGKPMVRRCYDGSTARHLLSANPVIENGELNGMEGFILNIEDESTFSDYLFYSMRNSSTPYYRCDEKGNIVEVNPAWRNLYAFPHNAEIKGTPYSCLVPRDEKEEFLNDLQRIMNGEALITKLTSRLDKNGIPGRQIWSASPVTIGNRIVAIEGFVLDLES